GGDRHHSAGHSDVEAGCAGNAVVAQAGDDVAQVAVIDVRAAADVDGVRVDAQGVAVEQVIVKEGAGQVIGGLHSVDVAREVNVQVLGRNHLRLAAAGGAALDAEHRAKAGLADHAGGLLADVREAHGDAHGVGGFAFAQGCGADGGDIDVLAVRAVFQPVQDREFHLGLYVAVKLEVVAVDAVALGDGLDRFQFGGACDLKVRLHPRSPAEGWLIVGGREF